MQQTLGSSFRPQFEESSVREVVEPRIDSASDCPRRSSHSHSFLVPMKRLVPKCWPENLLRKRQLGKGLMRTDSKEFKNLFARFVDFEVCYLHAVGVSSLERGGEDLQSSDYEEDGCCLNDDSFDQSNSLLSPPQTPELEYDELNSVTCSKQSAKENAVPRNTEITTKYKNSKFTTGGGLNRAKHPAERTTGAFIQSYSVQQAKSTSSVSSMTRVGSSNQNSGIVSFSNSKVDKNWTHRSKHSVNSVGTPVQESYATNYFANTVKRAERNLPVIIPSPVKPINSRASNSGASSRESRTLVGHYTQRPSAPAPSVKAKQPVKILTTRKPVTTPAPPSDYQSNGSHVTGHRLCIACGIDESPCWRPSWDPNKGQLCNSCGLRYRKNHYYCSNSDCVAVPSKLELNSIKSKCKPNELCCLNCGHHLIRT